MLFSSSVKSFYKWAEFRILAKKIVGHSSGFIARILLLSVLLSSVAPTLQLLSDTDDFHLVFVLETEDEKESEESKKLQDWFVFASHSHARTNIQTPKFPVTSEQLIAAIPLRLESPPPEL